MSDIFTPQQRSRIMSRIRSVETAPEILVRKSIFALGYRYRKNDKRLPGKPDIVFPKYKTAVFVHGCFWHGHEDCKNARVPETHTQYWVEKLAYNKKRDKLNCNKLKNQGWQVVIAWECEVEQNLNAVLERILKALPKKTCLTIDE